MGLDMYLYKIKKPSKEDFEIFMNNVNHSFDEACRLGAEAYDDIEDTDHGVMNILMYDDNEGMYEDLLPYSIQTKVKRDFLNYKKIEKDFGVTENMELIGSWSKIEGIGFTYKDFETNEEIKVEISREDIPLYTLEKSEDALVFLLEDVAYWRKEHELNEDLCDAYAWTGRDVENCGYHKCNEEMVEILRDRGLDLADTDYTDYDKALAVEENQALFYHIWF